MANPYQPPASELSEASRPAPSGIYFWRLEALKADLVRGEVNQGQSVTYLIWSGALFAALVAVPSGSTNVWDHGLSAFDIGVLVFGTLHAYRCNGGDSGAEFLVRYVAVSWVLTVRFIALAVFPVVLSGVALEALLFGGVPEHTTPLGVLLLGALSVGYYVRLGVHLREIAGSRAAA